MKTVNVMITAFRDGFQSVFGARVLTPDFIPALEAAAAAGMRHFEVGGGARFQSLYFYCNEDAFAMMDACRAAAGPDANLQTLARGINVVGLESQSSDIIRMHAELFKKHGMTTIRNFDALNDIDNLDFSGRCIAEAGLNHEVAVTLMGLPPGLQGAHTAEFYLNRIMQIIDAGIPMHSLVLKDASGTATPQVVYDTVKEARKRLAPEIPLRFHTHDTAGTGVITYKAAIEAGADGIDLALAPVSGGTSQPDVVTMWHALRGTEYQLDIDVEKTLEVEELFKECLKDYFFPPEAQRVEPVIPFSPMPGGALTANTQMMRDHNVLDRFPEVIAAMREVVERGGFATSVTPVSQFYFQQAFNNVVMGPWKKIADGYGKMLLGYFGKTPSAPDPELVALAAKQLNLEPTTESPRVLNDRDPAKGRAPAEKWLQDEGLAITEENVFIAATCRERGIAFLKGEGRVQVRKIGAEGAAAAATAPPQPNASAPAAGSAGGAASARGSEATGPAKAESYRVTVDGHSYTVEVAPTGAVSVAAAPGPAGSAGGNEGSAGTAAPSAPAQAAPAATGAGASVTAPMPGIVLKTLVKVGDTVAEGQAVAVMECMKMELQVESEVAGLCTAVHASDGQSVESGAVLVTVG